MEIGLLGTMKVVDGGVSCVPSAPKEQQLLALLLVNANQVVPVTTCLEELWSGTPPRSARTTVQTYVMHLRNALAGAPSIGSPAGAHQLLSTRESGYGFRVTPGATDVARFIEAVARGRESLNRGDDVEAVRWLRAGLRLWRGPALAGVPTGPVLDVQVTRLERTRLAVLEQCVAAELRLGRHHDLLGELTALAHRYPVDEALHAHYILALYRCGRQVEALDAHRDLADRLRADLGVAPSAQVQDVHRAILSGEAGLTPAVAR